MLFSSAPSRPISTSTSYAVHTMGASTTAPANPTETDGTETRSMPTSGLTADPVGTASKVKLVENLVSVFEASPRPLGPDKSGTVPLASFHEQTIWQQSDAYATMPRRSRSSLRTDDVSHACGCGLKRAAPSVQSRSWTSGALHPNDDVRVGDFSPEVQPLIDSVHTLTQHVIRIAQALEEQTPLRAPAVNGHSRNGHSRNGHSRSGHSRSGHSRTSSTLSESASTSSEPCKANASKAATTAAAPAFTFTAPPTCAVSRPCRRTPKSTSTPPTKGAKPTSTASPRNTRAPKPAVTTPNKPVTHSIPRRPSHNISPTTPVTPGPSQPPPKTAEKPAIRSPSSTETKTASVLVTLSATAPSQKQPQPAHLEHSRPVFGQVSTPPVRPKVEFNLADSPYASYCDENSPFALLRKRSGARVEE